MKKQALNNPPSNWSRRNFLKAAAAAWATTQVVPHRIFGANSKPSLGAVGIGCVGHGQVQSCAKAGFDVTALCDVDDVFARKTFDKFPQARRYRD